MRRYPHLYEANARLFLRRVSHKYGYKLTVANVPKEEWQDLRRLGFDLVWLMGVWQRSPGAQQKALLHEGLRQEYDRALPGWTDEDVAGSPYAIYDYRLDSSLGKPAELARMKLKLNKLGLGLILDFVPNHVALDHPWTRSYPQRFIQVSEADVLAHPGFFFSTEQGIYLAHGRDPNFPPWTDTAQLNFFSTDLRQALIEELVRISDVADGVRCDMAMLVLNDVFEGVWGKLTGYPRPDTEFWADAIAQVKRRKPSFLFLAEAYWGLEGVLQHLGFDFTYDKVLYDLLRYSSSRDIRNHLGRNEAYQQHSVHFIENHDEERAVIVFGRERSLAAAVVLSTVPGLRLFHDGQLEGRRTRLPVQLVHPPDEAADPIIARFYDGLLTICNSTLFHEGEWQLLEVRQAGSGNDSYLNILSWCWRDAARLKIAIINYSSQRSQGWLKLPVAGIEGITIHNELSPVASKADANPCVDYGLHLDLKPWEPQILDIANK